jgi:hypothetical protein
LPRTGQDENLNRTQTVALAITLANLVLILLFPPFDYLAVSRGSVPTFEGFSFYFSHGPNRLVNASFLYLEIFVVLTNGTIAWLLGRPRSVPSRGGFDFQRAILITVAVNLVVIMLFPPFENFDKITKATLPSFDGFYFVFGDNTKRVIVSTILYLEAIFVLVNGLIFWLLLKDRGREQLSAREIRRLSTELKKPR